MFLKGIIRFFIFEVHIKSHQRQSKTDIY